MGTRGQTTVWTLRDALAFASGAIGQSLECCGNYHDQEEALEALAAFAESEDSDIQMALNGLWVELPKMMVEVRYGDVKVQLERLPDGRIAGAQTLNLPHDFGPEGKDVCQRCGWNRHAWLKQFATTQDIPDDPPCEGE